MSTPGTPTPIRFRCSSCEKVLKVARSKAGQVVTCPACSVELIVPEAPPEAPAPAVEAAPSTPADPVSPLAFLNLKLDNGPPAAAPAPKPTPPPPPVAVAAPVAVIAPAPAPAPILLPAEPEAAPVDLGFPMIQVNPEPVVRTAPARKAEPKPATAAAAALSPAAVTLNERGIRRNDVVLSRSVVMLWSFTMLIAVVFAFTAGLLLGHFVWKG